MSTDHKAIVNISIDSIIVENRENGILGEVYISCPEDSYELLDNGRGIIGNISEILFRDYPALFIENDKSSLRINFYCGGEWVIENGKYNTIYYYD